MLLPFEAIIVNRRIFLSMLENYSLEQLNFIPKGYSNNIFWNIAHSVASMQLLVYSLSNSNWRIPKEIVKGYRNGTRPDRLYTQEEVDAVKSVLVSSAEQCEKDYNDGYFGDYKGFSTATGFDMNSIEDAINFNLYHEGLHMGYILAIKRFLADIV